MLMPRVARVKQSEAFYHIYNRGNNKDDIFIDDEDKLAFITRIKKYMKKFNFILLSYCIMTNHFHILIHSNGADISELMKGLSLSYGHYFRKKYNRCGVTFQNRFESVILDNSNSLIFETLYIHCNPLKAGIVNNPLDYKYSSAAYYLGLKDQYAILDNSLIMAIIGRKKSNCIKSYTELINQYVKDNDYEIEIKNVIKTNDDFDYSYENIEKHSVKRNNNPHGIIAIVAHRNFLEKNEILQRFTHRNSDAKLICIYLLYLSCNLCHAEIGKLFKLKASSIGHCITLFLQKLDKDEKLFKELEYYNKLIA